MGVCEKIADSFKCSILKSETSLSIIYCFANNREEDSYMPHNVMAHINKLCSSIRKISKIKKLLSP